jgi:hypothetical protein
MKVGYQLSGICGILEVADGPDPDCFRMIADVCRLKVMGGEVGAPASYRCQVDLELPTLPGEQLGDLVRRLGRTGERRWRVTVRDRVITVEACIDHIESAAPGRVLFVLRSKTSIWQALGWPDPTGPTGRCPFSVN